MLNYICTLKLQKKNLILKNCIEKLKAEKKKKDCVKCKLIRLMVYWYHWGIQINTKLYWH